jgi:hypothetical protein
LVGKNERQPTSPKLPARPCCVFRADGLRRVFDDFQAEAARDLHERPHVRHLPVQVHRHDRLDDALRVLVDELAVLHLAAPLDE